MSKIVQAWLSEILYNISETTKPIFTQLTSRVSAYFVHKSLIH